MYSISSKTYFCSLLRPTTTKFGFSWGEGSAFALELCCGGGRSIPTERGIAGAVTIKIISHTSRVSTRGVMLISETIFFLLSVVVTSLETVNNLLASGSDFTGKIVLSETSGSDSSSASRASNSSPDREFNSL